MKKILTLALLAIFSISANAQWERFDNGNTDGQTKKKRALIEVRSKKDTVDAKYLEGAVPMKDGKVVWEKEYDCKGKSADQIYDICIDMMKEFVKGEVQTDKSQIAVVNKAERTIGVRLREKLVFQNTFLSLDMAYFNYTLVINYTDGKCNVKMVNISYLYEPDRPTAAVYTAEEMISDKEALNKKKTGFTRGGSKKFRTKTIDRKDEVFAYIGEKLK